MSDCRKCAEFDWCVENEDCGLFKPKTQTNADRIRMMSDEELAEFLIKTACDATTWGICGSTGRFDKAQIAGGKLIPWLDWLKLED